MADKEERIFIRKGTAIELCKFIYRDGCAGEMHCCSCAISIPRSEAIDKMAKALCNWYYTACSECALRDKPKECKALLKDANFYEQAESELNTLLDDKK